MDEMETPNNAIIVSTRDYNFSLYALYNNKKNDHILRKKKV